MNKSPAHLHSDTDAAKPRWERRKDARPHELLSAALTLFVEKGYAATRLEDVAKQAGVSKGTLYLYFDNKEELFKAVVTEHISPALNLAETMIENFTGHSRELIKNVMDGWWQQVGSTPLAGLCKLVMAESSHFPEIARFYHAVVIDRAHKMIRSMIHRGQQRGEVRADIDEDHMAHVLCSPMVMLMIWHHSFDCCVAEPIDNQRYLAQYLELTLHGLLINSANTH